MRKTTTAILWSQLITQMIDLADEQPTGAATDSDIEEQQLSIPKYSHWQQQLRDDCLFSRHELVRTLYKYPKQSQAL